MQVKAIDNIDGSFFPQKCKPKIRDKTVENESYKTKNFVVHNITDTIDDGLDFKIGLLHFIQFSLDCCSHCMKNTAVVVDFHMHTHAYLAHLNGSNAEFVKVTNF